MKIATLTPTKGDRPQFVKHLMYLISRQTRRPDIISVVDEPSPYGAGFDLTWRVERGLRRCFGAGADLVIVMEDDDYYINTYIEGMVELWEDLGHPELVGIESSIYYHLKTLKWFPQRHPGRASLMSTALSRIPDKFPGPRERFLDIHLWKQDLFKSTFETADPWALGMKHGVGLCGGIGHRPDLRNYNQDDHSLAYLESVLDGDLYSLEFYLDIHKQLNQISQ